MPALLFLLLASSFDDVSSPPPCAESDPAAGIALVKATLFDSQTQTMVKGTTIIIRGERVVELGPSAEVRVPPDHRVIDLAGRWVIPGLIDAHVHLTSTQTPEGVVQEEVQKILDGFLVSGVTSILDCFGTDEIFVLRDLERRGVITAPRIFAAGAGLTAAGAHGTEFGIAIPLIATESEARERVEKLATFEPDLVKVVLEHRPHSDGREPTLSRAILEAITEGAHRHGLKVGVHALSADLAMLAVNAGADVLLHAFPDRGLPDAQLERLRERGVWVVPSLSVEEVWSRLVRDPGFLRSPPVMSAVDPRVLRRFTVRGIEALEGTMFEESARNFPAIVRLVSRLHRQGCLLAVGTDASNLGVFHGPAIVHELGLMVQSGLAPAEALASATLHGARLIGRGDDLGAIAPGRLADLLVVTADPLEDLNHLAQIEMVMKGGQIIDLEGLRKRIAGICTYPPRSKVIADFESASLASTAGSRPFGVLESGAGPHSNVTVEHVSTSAGGHLAVRGEVAAKSAAFAGVALHLSPYGLHAVDLEDLPILQFKVRGDGGVYLLELLTLDTGQGAFVRAFRAEREWTALEFRLNRLRPLFIDPRTPLDLTRALTLRVITATGRTGPFTFELDDVALAARPH